MTDFIEFPKMARLNRMCVITEKIDGTNAQILIEDVPAIDHPGLLPGDSFVPNNGTWFRIRAGSRSRWIHPGDDNYGFARWVASNAQELAKLGPGRHFGEWWGSGCQRGYNLPKGEKRFSLFNTLRWCAHDATPVAIPTNNPIEEVKMQTPVPACCHVVPEMVRSVGPFRSELVDSALYVLRQQGSLASPGFMKPEGIVLFHVAANMAFKVTLEKDDVPKSHQQKVR